MRLLFCSFDSPGHLFPLVGLALELRARGHDVAFAAGAPALATLGPAGLERIPRGEGDGPSLRVNAHHYPLSIAIDVKHVEYAVERFAPDLLVTHQLCHAPHLVRARRGIPVAVMGLFSYLWSYSPDAFPGVGSAALERRRRWRVESDLKILNDARALFQLPAAEADGAELPFLGDLFMLRTIPELQRELPHLPPRVHAVGACLWEPPSGPGAWDELRAAFALPDAPLVYVQHGRTFGGPGFWTQLAEALDGTAVQVVASVGRMDEGVGAVPANFVARDHVPQGLVLPHARAVVSGGHSSVVLAALAHGLPGVLVPTGGETPDNAEKLAEAGCALPLEVEGLTAGAVRDAVEAALEGDELSRGCRRVQRALARWDGFGHAAELVERLGATGAPVHRERSARPELAGAVA